MTSKEFVNNISKKVAEGSGCTLREIKQLVSLIGKREIQPTILNILNTIGNIFNNVVCDEALYTENEWGEKDEVSWVGVGKITSAFLLDEECKGFIECCNKFSRLFDIIALFVEYFDGYEIPYECATWYDVELEEQAYSDYDL